MEVIKHKYIRTINHLFGLDEMILDYEKEVSAQGHHCSIYYLITMAYLINHYKCEVVMDYGSGLTSALLWKYKDFLKCKSIFTIDDNQEWLDKTKEFMTRQKIKFDARRFIAGDENFNPKIKGNLISYDYSNMEARKTLMFEMLPKRISDKTIIMFDDAHKPDYMDVIEDFCDRYELKLIDLKFLTQRENWTDRYSVAGIKGIKDVK